MIQAGNANGVFQQMALPAGALVQRSVDIYKSDTFFFSFFCKMILSFLILYTSIVFYEPCFGSQLFLNYKKNAVTIIDCNSSVKVEKKFELFAGGEGVGQKVLCFVQTDKLYNCVYIVNFAEI